MTAIPVVYSVSPTVPNTVTASAELFAEQLEAIPYPIGMSEAAGGVNWPPAGFTGVTAMTTAQTNTASLLPQSYNLEWVQGDTAEFSFLFTDVFWVVSDPTVDTPIYANPARTVANKVLTSNVATLTTSAAHGYSVGFSITVSGVGSPFDGTFTITAIPSTTTFSYAVTNASVVTSAATGSVVVSNMPVWTATEWAAQVRNPYIYSTYAADYWVPAYGFQYKWWRANSGVASFDATADIIEMPVATPGDPISWATRVTLNLPATSSAAILPGSWYRWDIQSRTIDNVVRTHLRGKARIITEWTVA